MSHSHYPAARVAATRVSPYVPKVSLAMGGLGLIAGGASAAAKNIRRVKNSEITREEAVKDTIREAAGTGLATTAATAVVGALGGAGLLSLLGVAIVTTGTKYFWDTATMPEKAAAVAPKASKSKKTSKSK